MPVRKPYPGITCDNQPPVWLRQTPEIGTSPQRHYGSFLGFCSRKSGVDPKPSTYFATPLPACISCFGLASSTDAAGACSRSTRKALEPCSGVLQAQSNCNGSPKRQLEHTDQPGANAPATPILPCQQMQWMHKGRELHYPGPARKEIKISKPHLGKSRREMLDSDLVTRGHCLFIRAAG